MSIDDLSRGLASGSVTRRRALALLAASAVGMSIPRVAQATGNKCYEKCYDKNDCDKTCSECEKKHPGAKYKVCKPKKNNPPDNNQCKKKFCNPGPGNPPGNNRCGRGCKCVPLKNPTRPGQGNSGECKRIKKT